ncbi:hypothetical protein M5K25_014983 [Dendrobium thyrsiflorum]|uniref:Golgi apparatus membrane protein TVP15 n=1 Tax=Dendrobium thyrsiflorum TaxID=117978 RepID=A0ABD0UPF3_DENTH
MPKDMESGEASRHSPPILPPSRNRRSTDPFLVICRCFSVITALTAILCVCANVLSAIHSFRNGSDIFGGIFRCYAIALAIFVALVETEWNFILKFWRVLEYWVGRGMLQIFVAVMTRAFPDVIWARKDLVLLQEISSYLLLACGVTYVVAGLLCIGFFKRSRVQKETSREHAAKDLEELERRKRELEALLMEERDSRYGIS